jgi:hypothetical protein
MKNNVVTTIRGRKWLSLVAAESVMDAGAQGAVLQFGVILPACIFSPTNRTQIFSFLCPLTACYHQVSA